MQPSCRCHGPVMQWQSCGTAVAPAPTPTPRAAEASVRETTRLRGAIAREFRETSESENYTCFQEIKFNGTPSNRTVIPVQLKTLIIDYILKNTFSEYHSASYRPRESCTSETYKVIITSLLETVAMQSLRSVRIQPIQSWQFSLQTCNLERLTNTNKTVQYNNKPK